MREYMAWKEAHAKRGTKNKAERGADLHLSDDDIEDSDEDNEDVDNENDAVEDDDDDDDVVEDDDDDDGLGETDNGSDIDATAPRVNREPSLASRDSNGAGRGRGGGGGERIATDTGAGSHFDGAGGAAGGAEAKPARPWQKQQKRPRNKEKQQRKGREEEDGGEAGEWAAEEEEVAARMEHRKRFADDRTANMKEEDYVDNFFELRRAFFLTKRQSAMSRASKRKPSGSRAFLVQYLGLKPGSQEARDKKLLEALAYMMYDHVGRVVEAAIRKRTGGRLVCDTSDPMLSAEEINAAGATIPLLSGRRERESLRAFRAANPDGIAHGRPLGRFPVGLEHRGNPLRWPRNTIEGGRVLVEGGEVVDTNDKSLADEAMALLESDFADFV